MKTIIAIITLHAAVAITAVTGASGDAHSPHKAMHESRETIVTGPMLEAHEFTGANGRTCHGRVVGYNASTGIVTIEKKDNGTCKVELALLSPGDQSYVREWHLIKEFFTANRIRISAREKKCADDQEKEFHNRDGQYLARQALQSIGYEIDLQNWIKSNLTEVKLEYCIYFEQDRPDRDHGSVTVQGVKCGTLNIGTLAAGARIEIDSKPALLFQRERERGPGSTLQADIRGIWIRLYIPLDDGRRAMLEYATPKRILKVRQWATTDSPVLTEKFLRHNMRKTR